MGTEPERKFLTASDSWKKSVSRTADIFQAYLSKDKERTVRLRIVGDEAFITIKGRPPTEDSIETPEFEYAIPKKDAEEMMKFALPGAIEKTRHYVEHMGHTWEVDVFKGKNAGLVVAEIELAHGGESFARPPWLGEEVTFDPRYKNANLSENPYSEWKCSNDDSPFPTSPVSAPKP